MCLELSYLGITDLVFTENQFEITFGNGKKEVREISRQINQINCSGNQLKTLKTYLRD
jgi:hypothetical protein